MAAPTHVSTLSANTAATTTLTGEFEFLRIIPTTVTDHVYARVDGVTAVVGADGAILCALNGSTTIKVPFASGSTAVSLICTAAGNVYVEGVRDKNEASAEISRVSVK